VDEPPRDFPVFTAEGVTDDPVEPCVFCEIVAGRAPASRIWEDSRVLAFLALATVTVGHLVVIPKVHAETLDDLTDDLAAQLFDTARVLARGLRSSDLPCYGVNLSLADGRAAGQQVDHLHLHVVPRTLHDDYRVLGRRRPWTRHELDAVAFTIRSSLGHT
jgi:histidine triad (HIT) family protein